MKIHTNTLTRRDIVKCLPSTCQFWVLEPAQSKSRTHKSTWEIRLKGEYKSNKIYDVGQHVRSATYEEWGWFLADIFHLEPDAKCGPYKNAVDFHNKTKQEFM